MKLVVCGCSWSSRDPSFPNTEHGYFIAEHFGWEYHNIARVGCDIFGIRLLIDYAVDVLKADIILVNWTTACRVTWNHKGKRYYPTHGLKQLDYDVDDFFDNERCHPAKDDPDFDPTIIAQSITGLVSFGNLMGTYEEAIEEWPWLPHHMSEKQFYAFREYYIHLYDDDLEAHKQYYLIESAVSKLQKSGTKFVMSPNTFNFAQAHAMKEGHSIDDHESINRAPHDEMYNEWNIIPKENIIAQPDDKTISDTLQWDFEIMEDPINYPTHDHCHHLSAESQERWANEVAIPKLKGLL